MVRQDSWVRAGLVMPLLFLAWQARRELRTISMALKLPGAVLPLQPTVRQTDLVLQMSQICCCQEGVSVVSMGEECVRHCHLKLRDLSEAASVLERCRLCCDVLVVSVFQGLERVGRKAHVLAVGQVPVAAQ